MNVLVLTLVAVVGVGMAATLIAGLAKGAGRPTRTGAHSGTARVDGGWFGGWSDGGGCHGDGGGGGGGGGDGGGC